MNYIAKALGLVVVLSIITPTANAYAKPALSKGATSNVTSKNSEELYRQGLAKVRRGDYKGAIEIYNQVLQLNPNDARAYLYRGNAYMAVGERQKAMMDYARARRLNPNEMIIFQVPVQQ